MLEWLKQLFKIDFYGHLTRKPTKWAVRPAKTQISLGIRPVWSESAVRSLGS